MKDNISKRTKEFRDKKGLSQELLAEISGLSLRTIQRIENGESKPRGATLTRMAGSLDVSPDELIESSVSEDKGFFGSFKSFSSGIYIISSIGNINSIDNMDIEKRSINRYQ